MAKEKFLIVATPNPDDCFSLFSESENKLNISAGTADPDDAYSWIEGSFTIELRRYREATHVCSFTPSAYYIWLQNAFAGEPNEAWLADGDPEGLEYESGGDRHGYGTYYDEYDPRYVCDTFTIDTMHDMDPPMRKSDSEAYHNAIWKRAEGVAQEIGCNSGFDAPILHKYAFRQRERELSPMRMTA